MYRAGSASRLASIAAIACALVACETGGVAQHSSSPKSASPTAAASPSTWPSGLSLAVYDGSAPDGATHVVNVVGISAGDTAKVLATAKLATRSVPPNWPKCVGCPGPLDLPYVSTSTTKVYVLDGDTTVRVLAANGSASKVRSLPGSSTARVAFSVSPDDSQIAVAVLDYSALPVGVKLFVENLDGSAHRDLAADTFYWPVGWHGGKIVLGVGPAVGSRELNQYSALESYALVDPIAGARPALVGVHDCAPSGLLTAAGTACISSRPDTTLCLGDLVANAASPYYYNSCLRRLDWSGKETIFLLPNDSYTSTFSVGFAALSPDGRALMTDHLGPVLEPVSATHGGNNFLGTPSWATIRVSAQPGLGWIDPSHFSMTIANPDGTFAVRIFSLNPPDYNGMRNVSFEGTPDIVPGVPGSPVTGQLMGTIPGAL